MNNLHEWQKDGFTKVITKCNRTDEHNVIPVNASVGSGKTFFGSLAYADFIDLHKNEKTIQFFVTPRIKLCAQQSKEVIGKIATCEPYSYQQFEEFPGNGSPFQVIQVDCTHHEWSRSNDNLTVQHAIFIICDASLWGEDKNMPNARWNAWRSRFKAWKKAGYIFGNIIFDEAHNFKNDDKVTKMFGTTIFKKHIGIDYINNECLLTYFHNVILLSGTPAAYQKELTTAFSKNVCECPLNVAIKNNWVEYPILNLVNIGYESAATIFSNVVIKVLQHEVANKPKNGVRLLVNFGSIDEIDTFEKDNYIMNHMGKDFHFITIHSDKMFKDKEMNLYNCKSMVNGIECSSSDVYDLLEGLDSGNIENEEMQSVLNGVLDGKPIIVGQVAMIGEGINIKSFNSVITKSNSDTTAMQQIGRVLRKYNGKKFPNVYCVYDNVSDLKTLLANLMYEHSLTADCFDWGKKLDVSTGSSNINDTDEEGTTKSGSDWVPIDPNKDADIVEIQYSEEFKNVKLAKNLKSFTDSDAFDSLVHQFSKSFDSELRQMIFSALKNSNKATKDNKQIKIHKNGRKKNVVESPIMNDTVHINAKDNQIEIVEVVGESSKLTETIDTTSSTDLIYELVKTVRGFVLRHQDDKMIIEKFKKHPDYLVQYLFSYIPALANKICEVGICFDKNFLTLVGLD